MAYKINRDDEHIVEPDGIASLKDVRRMLTSTRSPEFYELEPAEVIQVFLDEEDLPVDAEGNTDWSQYGYAKVRMSISHESAGDYILAAPLDSNIKQYPYPTEYVIVVNYFGTDYYTQKLNLLHSVNTNNFPGLSTAYNPQANEIYKENLPTVQNSKIREIDSEEGDITFNGRFGNTIRLGSNIKEIKEGDGVKEHTGKENSPNVIIRAGQGVEESIPTKPIKEDINLDGSSLWMTTDQLVPFERSSEKAHAKTYPQKYDGKQIIINSDRIVFNTKLNSIHAFSKNEISMAADRRLNLESPIVNLADRMADQPAIAGDVLMDDIIWPIVDALVQFANGIQPTMASVIDFKVPLDNIVGPSSTLSATLAQLKTSFKDSAKSTTVFVGNPKGPAV